MENGYSRMELILIDNIDVEEFDLANITDHRLEIGTPVFDGDVAPIWSE